LKTFISKTWRALSISKGIQLSVMRLFQDQFLVGVTGVIFNEKQEVLLFKHIYRQNKWSLPGGYMKSKEHPFEALEREIIEESGLVVSADEEIKIRTDRETPRLDVTVVGKHIGGEFKPSSEVSDFGFFSFENLPFISKNQLLLIEHTLQSTESLKNETVISKEAVLIPNKSQPFLKKLQRMFN